MCGATMAEDCAVRCCRCAARSSSWQTVACLLPAKEVKIERNHVLHVLSARTWQKSIWYGMVWYGISSGSHIVTWSQVVTGSVYQLAPYCRVQPESALSGYASIGMSNVATMPSFENVYRAAALGCATPRKNESAQPLSNELPRPGDSLRAVTCFPLGSILSRLYCAAPELMSL